MNSIKKIPDFTNYGYRVNKQLKEDIQHSSITWQGIKLSNNSTVIIKQFRFATKDSSWSKYQAYQQEIELLKKLDRPGIPKYIADFETEDSFCFVREYIDGSSLTDQTNITEQKLIQIAVKVLENLIYLQQQQPPILHLNITPENILLDPKFNVYLINFSRAQNNKSQVNYSSIETSNAEFIAPEQFTKPVMASDNYGLGATLNKTINKQRSLALTTANNLANSDFLLELDYGFQEWLTTMTNVEVSQRYADAEAALQGLRNSSWDEIETVTKSSDNTALSNRGLAAGILTMGILGFAIAIGIDVTQRFTEKSFANITIALMGMAIIYLTQSASATLITNDNSEKKQGITLAVATPIILAIVTGLIFGRGEAVAMSLATVVAQTFVFGYALWQKLPYSESDNTWKVIVLGIAIAFGLFCGVAIT